MERTSRLARVSIIFTLATIFLSGCYTIPQTTVGVIEAPKVTIDARLLEVCDIELTALDEDAEFEKYVESYGEAITLLNACACKFRETRNLACTISKVPCTVVPSCKGVSK